MVHWERLVRQFVEWLFFFDIMLSLSFSLLVDVPADKQVFQWINWYPTPHSVRRLLAQHCFLWKVSRHCLG